ncbi:unnamed protein product [Polarella glacialis]|uniref:Uncharacterized protein n=1 Tax=Polarella glacialis TaxID=89957 RepID=A0A813DEM5_POLGL|nr:unnamed protein product [Polarella glacialis]
MFRKPHTLSFVVSGLFLLLPLVVFSIENGEDIYVLHLHAETKREAVVVLFVVVVPVFVWFAVVVGCCCCCCFCCSAYRVTEQNSHSVYTAVTNSQNSHYQHRTKPF